MVRIVVFVVVNDDDDADDDDNDDDDDDDDDDDGCNLWWGNGQRCQLCESWDSFPPSALALLDVIPLHPSWLLMLSHNASLSSVLLPIRVCFWDCHPSYEEINMKVF